jgi:hypothetical protein
MDVYTDMELPTHLITMVANEPAEDRLPTATLIDDGTSPVKGGKWTRWLSSHSRGGELLPPSHGFTARGCQQPQQEPEAYAACLYTFEVNYYGHSCVSHVGLQLCDGRRIEHRGSLYSSPGDDFENCTFQRTRRKVQLRQTRYEEFLQGLSEKESRKLFRAPAGWRICGLQIRRGEIIDNARLLLAPHPRWTPAKDRYFSDEFRAAAAAVMEHGRSLLPEDVLIHIIGFLREEDFPPVETV